MTQTFYGRAAHAYYESEVPDPFEREDQTWDIIPAFTRFEMVDVAELRPRILRRSLSEVESTFRQAAQEWRDATAAESNAVVIVMHPAYQRIIGLGSPAVPLIIDALKSEVDHWFWALRAIVGHDVAEGATSLRDAALRWIDWYERELV